MKTHKTKYLLLNFSTMKKLLHYKLCCFGKFYKEHWKALVASKVILAVILLTLAFSVRTNDGKVVYHGAGSTYAQTVPAEQATR
jgi:hypothetical protein